MFYNTHKHLVILLFIMLTSCSDENIDIPNPAHKHIEQYTKNDLTQQKLLGKHQIDDNTLSQQKNINITINENKTDTKEFIQDPINIFNIKPTDIVLGNPKAKAIILEYSSLTCPHCAYYHTKIFKFIEKKYIETGKIAYIMREFITCKQDLEGAVLARCIGNNNQTMNILQILFQEQEKWAFNYNYKENLLKIGKLFNISKDTFEICINNETVKNILINNSKEISTYPGFLGTPKFFINKNEFKNAYSQEELSKAIDEIINNNQ